MFYEEYISKKKDIQNKLLEFIDKEDNIEENYQNLINLLSDQNFEENKHELKLILYLILQISNHHHRGPDFFKKIEQILQFLKDFIIKNFSNSEVFNLFKKNKKILLILIQLNIFKIDQSIVDEMMNLKYDNQQYYLYFAPEIIPFITDNNNFFNQVKNKNTNVDEKSKENNSKQENSNDLKQENNDDLKQENSDGYMLISSSDDDSSLESSDDDNSSEDDESTSYNSESESDDDDDVNNEKYRKLVINEIRKFFPNGIPEDFYEKRNIGENDNNLCNIIRKDLIEEFIIYVNKYDYSLNSTIEESMYETNPSFIDNDVSLIKYAAFFGSVQIFRYLYLNKVQLIPSLWIYGIHSDNPELIYTLEENNVVPLDETYNECLKESIKCHHSDITNYIQNNFIKNKKDIDIQNLNQKQQIMMYSESYCFRYYNFLFFPENFDSQFLFNYLCKYDYYTLVEYILKNKRIDLKEKNISIKE